MANMQIGNVEENRKPRKKGEVSIQFSFLVQMGNRSTFRMTVPTTKPKHLKKLQSSLVSWLMS